MMLRVVVVHGVCFSHFTCVPPYHIIIESVDSISRNGPDVVGMYVVCYLYPYYSCLCTFLPCHSNLVVQFLYTCIYFQTLKLIAIES